MKEKFLNVREKIKLKKHLIHCITNPISINQCANVILSLGAKPIMAEHPKEVCEITKTSSSLMLNTGNITDVRMESIRISVKKAKEINIPILLDAVGISCSKLRRKFIWDLLKETVPSVIKGNYSEILALFNDDYSSFGVDADGSLDKNDILTASKKLALKYKTVILATGKTDVITDGKNSFFVNNGTEMMANITGTGCMLGALITTFMTLFSPLEATYFACIYFGICGELSETTAGYGSFMVDLMDKISTLDNTEISDYANVEEI